MNSLGSAASLPCVLDYECIYHGPLPKSEFPGKYSLSALRRLPENTFELSKLDDSVILPTFLSVYRVYNVKSANTRGCAVTSEASGADGREKQIRRIQSDESER